MASLQDPSFPAPVPDPEVLQALGLANPVKRRREKWIRLGVLSGVVIALGFGGQRLWQARAQANKPVFKTMQVKRTDIKVTVSASGTLEGQNTVEVGTEVSGKLTEVKVDFNDIVHVGQVLAVIDPEQSKAAVDEATAQVASADAAIFQARATLLESKQKFERAKGQLEDGLIAQQDYEGLEANWARAQASLASSNASATLSRASLKSAKSRLEKATILSPIDGVVLSRLVESGQTVTAGMTTPVLFKLAQDLRRMSLSVLIDEADIGRVREGQEASFTVDAYPERNFASRVLSLRNDPTITQNVVTYEAILSADNAELLLRPGMTAAATVTIETRARVLALPNAALRFAPSTDVRAQLRLPGVPRSGRKSTAAEKRGPEVWVLTGEAPSPRGLGIGASDGAYTEITSGELKEGTAVIVDVEEKK